MSLRRVRPLVMRELSLEYPIGESGGGWAEAEAQIMRQIRRWGTPTWFSRHSLVLSRTARSHLFLWPPFRPSAGCRSSTSSSTAHRTRLTRLHTAGDVRPAAIRNGPQGCQAWHSLLSHRCVGIVEVRPIGLTTSSSRPRGWTPCAVVCAQPGVTDLPAPRCPSSYGTS